MKNCHLFDFYNNKLSPLTPWVRQRRINYKISPFQGSKCYLSSSLIIHQIFLLVRDWSKHVRWLNISQLKLRIIQQYFPIFKTAHAAKKIWRIINTLASFWRENMLGYLSLGIICSSKPTVFLELLSQKTVRFSEQIKSVDKYPSIFSRKVYWSILFIYPTYSSGIVDYYYSTII